MYLVDDETTRVEINKNVHSKNENYDYARISEAEAKIRVAEQEAQKNRDDKRSDNFYMLMLTILMLAALIYIGISEFSSKNDKQALLSSAAEANIDVITTLHSSGEYVDEDYHLVEQDLSNRGFTNIIFTVEKSKTKPGTVSSVTINGESFQSGESFPSNAEVVIKYRAENLFN